MRALMTWLKDNAIIIFFGVLLEVFFLMFHPQVPLEPLIASSPWLIKYGETFPLFAAFVPYFFCFLESRRTGRTDPKLVIGFAALFALTLVSAVLPTLSADVGGYAFYGKLWPGYGADPYGSISQNFPAEPFSTSGTWTRWLNPYGPLWTLIATFVMAVVGGNFVAGVVVFKILATLAFFGSAFLLLALRRRLHGEGDRRNWPSDWLLLFLWNPYALFEAAHEGHNDFVLIFFLALAFWLFVRGRRALAAVALGASVFTKYATVLLLPVFLVAVFKRDDRRLKPGLAAVGSFLLTFLAAGALVAIPFWHDALFNGLRNQLSLIHNSGYYGLLPFFVNAGLRHLGFYPWPAAELTHELCTVLFAVVFALICLVFLRRRSPGDESLVKVCFLAMSAYLLIDSFWFMPWYFLWLAPLAFVTEGYATFIILTICGLAATGTYIGPVVSWVLLGIAGHMAWRVKSDETRFYSLKKAWANVRSRFFGR